MAHSFPQTWSHPVQAWRDWGEGEAKEYIRKTNYHWNPSLKADAFAFNPQSLSGMCLCGYFCVMCYWDIYRPLASPVRTQRPIQHYSLTSTFYLHHSPVRQVRLWGTGPRSPNLLHGTLEIWCWVFMFLVSLHLESLNHAGLYLYCRFYNRRRDVFIPHFSLLREASELIITSFPSLHRNRYPVS